MTHSPVLPVHAASPAPRAVPARAAHPALDALLARRVLGQALLLGLTADALLRDSLVGLALPVWVALAALVFVALGWSAGRGIPREVAGWLLAAVAFAGTVAWRDAELLQLAGVLAVLGALLMAAVALHRPSAALLAHRLRDLLWAALAGIARIAAGFAPVLFESVIPGEASSLGRRATPMLRAGLFAGVLLLVFGSLLRGADPIFASLVALPELDVGTVASHALLSLFFAWLVSGWARAALDERPPSDTPELPLPTLGSAEVTASLGALNLLFATYVLAQLGWFFGGERFLRERTGLTAATYAREGFFQMLAVVLLVVPLLLATRALLAPGRDLARRHTRLALPLLALLGVMVVSAAARMKLYVHYYGLTTDRFYPMVLMLWLGAVLAWLAMTVLRDRGERFVAGTLVSGLATLLLLDVVSPDRIVARVNVARAAAATADAARPLDLEHLARLSGEAVPLAVAMTLAPPGAVAGTPERLRLDAQRCLASLTLLRRWGPQSFTAELARRPSAWRMWNAGAAQAMHAVGDDAPRLRAVRAGTCSAAQIDGSRRRNQED